MTAAGIEKKCSQPLCRRKRKKSWCYYPHWSRDLVSSVCGIFFFFFRFSWFLKPIYISILFWFTKILMWKKKFSPTHLRADSEGLFCSEYIRPQPLARGVPSCEEPSLLINEHICEILWMNLSLLCRQSTLLLAGSSTDDGWASSELRCSTHYKRNNFSLFLRIVRES